LIAAILGPNGPAFPDNYAIILTLAGFFLLVSLTSWSFVIEPEEPVQEMRANWRDYLPQLMDTLRQDRAFARLILVRLLAGCDGLALGFYILFATRELGLPPETIGLFTAAQTVGRIAASIGMGTLAERAGSHRVVQVATGISFTAPIVGLALIQLEGGSGTLTAVIFAWVFVTLGITINSNMLGYYNYVLEHSPAGQRPTYIGLLNTMSGILVILPTLGGTLLRATSYTVLFALTGCILIIAHLFSLTLSSARDPSPEITPETVA
jgi:hypothetical protein